MKQKPAKRIPISALKQLADEQGQDIAVLYTFDAVGKVSHVVTWGRSLKQCEQAAEWGNRLKGALGWPESLQAQPARVKRIQEENAQLRARIAELGKL